MWDLGLGIFERREPPIELRDCVLEHRAVRRRARHLQIGQCPRSRQR